MNETQSPRPPSYGRAVKDEEDLQLTVYEPKSSGLRSIASTALILLAAPLIALFLTAYVFQSYEVDGPSMETTLQNKDRLIVLKVPRTISRLTGKPYVPERGEIIIFVKHNMPEYGQVGDKQLIKRVIGVPGDRVVVSGGKVTVYNDENPGGFNPDNTMPYGKSINITTGEVDVTVPPGQVFVLGDNRGNSLDSRSFQPATVPSRDIVGKLVVRLFPLNKAQTY